MRVPDSMSLLVRVVKTRWYVSSPSRCLRWVKRLAHEMARIMYFMLSRDEPYRGENRGLTERKLKNMSKKAFNGLRN